MKKLHQLFCSAFIVLVAGCSGYNTEDSFDLGDGFRCKITSKNEWEPNVPYFYEITRNGKEEVDRSHFTSYPVGEEPSFQMLSSKDNRLFGLVNKTKPNAILMLFDKKELNSWPHRSGTENYENAAARGDKLLAALRLSMKNEKLELNPDR